MKARSTIVTALALAALAAPAAQANIPGDGGSFGPSPKPRYHCLVRSHGRMILIASWTKCKTRPPVHKA